MAIKTGLLGGAFNPPHLAHLSLAEHAKKAFHLKKMIFIPTHVPPHKTIAGDWNDLSRSLMIRIASFSDTPEEISRRMGLLPEIKKDTARFLKLYAKEFRKNHDPDITVSDIEIERPEISYTIDTVKLLMERFPDREFHIIIGMDQAAVFDTWKNWEELSRLARICAANRPGTDDSIVREKYPFIKIFHIPPKSLSSSEIREKIVNHQRFGAFVPKIIEEFLSLYAE